MPISLSTGGHDVARAALRLRQRHASVPPLPPTLVLEGAAQPVMSKREASQASCACWPIGAVIVRADYTRAVAARRFAGRAGDA
jgi:hypothetical protein